MQNQKDQLIITIIAIILVLLFLGILFLILLFYYNNKKMQMAREQQRMKDAFEKQLLESQLEIQDQTFNSISQEIHDNVGQTLSLAKVQVNIMDQRGVFDKDILQEVKDSIGSALADLRDIAKSLSGERIQMRELTELIGYELHRIKRTGLFHTLLDVNGEGRKMEYKRKLILFRMVQESLQNIIKHAKASEIRVLVHYSCDGVKVIIRDNGIGFDIPAEVEKGNGLGLHHIISRASMISGVASISSTIQEGTSITIIIPYEG